MTQTEPGGIVPANDNGPVDPAAKARFDELVFALASALGRQIARGEFTLQVGGANDNVLLPSLASRRQGRECMDDENDE